MLDKCSTTEPSKFFYEVRFLSLETYMAEHGSSASSREGWLTRVKKIYTYFQGYFPSHSQRYSLSQIKIQEPC